MSSEENEITADPSDEDSADADSQTTGLYINLAIGIPVTILSLLLFDPIRRRFPHIFETRRKLHEAREPLDYLGNRVSTPPAPSYKFLGWFLPTLRLDLETVTDTHGLDVALMLRYHRFMLALFTALLVPSVILLPTYYSGTDNTLPKDQMESGVNILSISNISPNDEWRFWMVLAMEYLIGGFVCYFLFVHFSLYCRDRRRYRAARHPANYAILVQDVPEGARTADAVSLYWDRVFPGQIASVFYVHDARRLEKMKTSFWSAVSEREVAEYRLHRARQRHQSRLEKRAMRAHLSEVRRRKKSTPLQTSSSREDDEPDLENGDAEHSQPSQPSHFHDTYDTNIVNAQTNTVGEHVEQDDEIQRQSPAVSKEMEEAMADLDNIPVEPEDGDGLADDADGNTRRKWYSGLVSRRPPKKPEAAVRYWEKAQRKAWAKVMAYQMQRDGGHFAVTSSAVVVFKSRRAASIAAQTNFSRHENEWRVSRAPEPNSINWGALCVPGWTIYLRQAITILLSSSLTLFWIAPITMVMTLASIKGLTELEIAGWEPFETLKFLQNLPPLASGAVESFLPTVILSLFLNFIPNIFAFFVSISRITSLAERDRQVRDWNFTFVTFSNFLFVAFAGSLLSNFAEIVKEPTRTADFLAQNIPKQAAFMMNFILLAALTETPLELLQFSRVGTSFVKLKYFSKTQRQREEAQVGDAEFDFVGVYSMSQLVTLLGLVYCTIQPLITVCCIVYFLVAYVVFKYNACYSMFNEYEDGGRMYGGSLYAVWVGLFSHFLTMIGVFGLNKSLAQSILIIIPTVLSVLYIFHCRRSFGRVLEHGSALETQDRVEKMEGCTEDVIEDELAETYEHPGWEELPNYEDVENLNGINNSDDDNDKKGDDMDLLDGLSNSVDSEGEHGGDQSDKSLAMKVKQMSNIMSDISGEPNAKNLSNVLSDISGEGVLDANGEFDNDEAYRFGDRAARGDSDDIVPRDDGALGGNETMWEDDMGSSDDFHSVDSRENAVVAEWRSRADGASAGGTSGSR